ncbi:DUF4012 domain-containing protein [Nocardioides sp.]|uniref:DUF4012 domain-containing protein n=1 Tax=Nocardioides sp. TaxID=35761 RepID=UPI00378373E9
MTLRRTLWTVIVVVVVAALAYTAWLVWQVQRDLRGAESSASQLKAAWRDGDKAVQDQAAADLADDAASADAHTSGVWWRAMGHLPFVGDDVDGVAAMSRSLDVISSDAVAPLSTAVQSLDGLVADGAIDLDKVATMEQPVSEAHTALATADDDLAGLDRDGYVGPLRTRFDKYADLVHGLRSGLASADKAVSVLPSMAGADGPKDYLLLFQNNAEIRDTGGMPGSWALIHADDGRIEMTRQGAATDFPATAAPVIPLSDEEEAVYGKELGIYFQDPGWTGDFPRAAELWQAHWDQKFPDSPIDGVLAIDPVGMSYLLDGTGAVTVDDVTLSRSNAVSELLSKPYIEEGPEAQNAFFAKASKAIFDAATGSLASPTAFAEGLNRAAGEGRLLISSFDAGVSSELAGTSVEGAMAGDDGSTPHVDIGLSDLTGSKMSYYLRYSADVDAVKCDNDVQQLTGTLTLGQAISPSEAAKLPVSVTGGGRYGTEPGSQYVMVRVHGPYGGSIDQVRLNGKTLPGVKAQQLNGRPVVSIDVLISSRDDQVLTWEGSTGQGQTGDGHLRMTPSVLPGADQRAFSSSC